MKIAYFTDSYLPFVNGVSYAVDTFAKKLGETNQVEIYAPACGVRRKNEKLGQVSVRRYKSVAFPTYKEFQFAVPNLPDVIRNVEKFNPDVIHFHTPGTMGLVGILMAKRMHKPLVGTYHSLVSEMTVYTSPRNVLAKYLQAIDRTIEGLGIDVKLLRGRNGGTKTKKPETLTQKMVWSVANRIYDYADLILCPSESIRNELRIRGINKKVEVLSNGLDLARFPAKTEYGIQKKVLHVGRLGFEKNVDVVIKAFGLVADKIPEASLTIVGDGPARDSLQEMAANIGLSERVIFTGMLPREDLSQVYRTHNVFVTASTMETQGLVALEAMVSGLPVVGVKKYALIDLIKSGRNGFLVNIGDSENMGKGIMEILGSHKLEERMGREAANMSKIHDMNKVIQRLLGMYSQVMTIDRKSWGENVRIKLRGWLA